MPHLKFWFLFMLLSFSIVALHLHKIIVLIQYLCVVIYCYILFIFCFHNLKSLLWSEYNLTFFEPANWVNCWILRWYHERCRLHSFLHSLKEYAAHGEASRNVCPYTGSWCSSTEVSNHRHNTERSSHRKMWGVDISLNDEYIKKPAMH